MLHQQIDRCQADVPHRVEDIVALRAIKSPAKVALVAGDQRCTYAELQRAIEEAANRLACVGVRPRDRIMLICENSIAAVALYFACTSIGAWPVIVNARLASREIDGIREHCSSRLIVFTTGASARTRSHAERYGAEQISDLSGLGPMAFTSPNTTAQPEPELDSDPREEVAAIIYTTGTTGRPKGIMLSHANLLFVANATANARRLMPGDKVCALLPMSHSLGLTGVLLSSLVSGAEVHLHARFDPTRVLGGLANDGVSVMIGMPSMYAMLVEYAKRNALAPIAAPALRLISSAGAPLDAATKASVEAAFGQTLHNGYGISECSPSIALTALYAPRGDCSVGRILPGIETKLAGTKKGSDIGELLVRGPGVMKGYYNAAEETRAAIDDEGWFRTGDLARFEGDHLFIVGRAKEMIIRFGYNVYPAEIEAVLNAHPGVLRSAVIGREQDGTEDILALVQLVDGATASATELADHAAFRLTAYKRPSEIVIVPEMPLEANGKIRKAALGDAYRTRAAA
ncbi:MAG: AMP-binding protein [Alphaproteobacteria bacterium]|nr:AMP-binding protein [Alphaproteobacteria bacterium]